jgi:4'-phosphopantetheinyl transferase
MLSSAFDLEGRRIEVWTVRTAASLGVTDEHMPILAPDEIDRAARLRIPCQRDAFILVRGILRTLLGRYLDVSPASIRFQYGSNGKPALAALADLHFNASHTEGLAVFAFASGCALGVDIERMRAMPQMHSIARRFFCAEEADELQYLNQDRQEQAFFLCWTRKEAYIKAIGGGMAVPLDSFRVTLAPDQPARLIHVATDQVSADHDETGKWNLCDLSLAPDYAAALAYRGVKRTVAILPALDAAAVFSGARDHCVRGPVAEEDNCRSTQPAVIACTAA